MLPRCTSHAPAVHSLCTECAPVMHRPCTGRALTVLRPPPYRGRAVPPTCHRPATAQSRLGSTVER